MSAPNLIRTAEISEDGLYRYSLTRVLDPLNPRVAVWVLCNPSKADGLVDDPSVRKGIGFSQRWGCGSMVWVNFWAFRSTDPWALLKAEDPIGPENDAAIANALRGAHIIIAAWGDVAAKLPIFMDRLPKMLAMMKPYGLVADRVRCLGKTVARHQPRHPLMLGYSTPLEAYP